MKTISIELRAIVIAAMATLVAIPMSAELTLKECVLGSSLPSGIGQVTPALEDEYYYEFSEDHSRIVKRSYATGDEVGEIFNSAKARFCEVTNWAGFEMSADESYILLWTNVEPVYRYSFKADYYYYEVRHNRVDKLTEDGGEEIATLSPDSRMVAYVKDRNVWIKKIDYKSTVQVTTDGAEGVVTNGVPDWVYQEEFDLLNSLAWSPDCTILSFIRWDESEVPLYSMTLYGEACKNDSPYELYPGSMDFKYPKAGYDNARVSVLSYDVDNRTLKTANLPISERDYVPRIEYGTTSDRLMVTTLNRNQNLLQIYTVNPRSTVAKILYREQSTSWIDLDNADAAVWGENDFYILSDKTGHTHLYHYSNSGNLIAQVTNGDWDVTKYYGYDAKNKAYYIQCTMGGPLNRVIAKVDAKGKTTALSGTEGTYSAQWSSGFGYYIENFSNTTTPPQYRVKSAKGKELRAVELNQSYAAKYSTSVVPTKEFFTIPSDGYQLNAYCIKPVDFDATKKYPVILAQYSGPGSQKVVNSWRLEWEHYFATQGYVIVSVDTRGTGGRGKDFEALVYGKIGQLEARDQVAAARYMAAQPWVDAEHIGIWGWSYGGYITLMSMSEGTDNPFVAGVAIAPVTDWRQYDTVYTERYLKTPQQNEDGYIDGSAIGRVGDLSGRLLIIAGTADDNVHLTNTLQYQVAATDAGKIIDMMIYTNMNHSINYCNVREPLYIKVLDHFNNYLK